jgi:hypothetical protein
MFWYDIDEIDKDISRFHTRFELPREIQDKLQKLEGIEKAYIPERYSISLKKGRFFSWDLVLPKVLEVLSSLDPKPTLKGDHAIEPPDQICANWTSAEGDEKV